MQVNDYVVRATAANNSIRALAAVTTGIAGEAADLHGLSPVASAALGRTLTAAVLMSGLLKGEKDTITIQIKGNGPLGGIIVVCDSRANVRGYVHNPHVDLPLNEAGKFDVAAAVGRDGYLNVIKDLGLKEPYIGNVKLVSGEIAEDVAYYFASSEQVPSAVSLGVLIDTDCSVLCAGGFLIQLLPDAEAEVIDFLEARLRSVPPVSGMLQEGKSPEQILEMLLGERGLEIVDKYPCSYKCTCSRERMEKGLISLGKDEILDMAKEQHGAELTCHFCNKKYHFSEDELQRLADQKKTKISS